MDKSDQEAIHVSLINARKDVDYYSHEVAKYEQYLREYKEKLDKANRHVASLEKIVESF